MTGDPIPTLEESPAKVLAFLEAARKRMLDIADRCESLGLSPVLAEKCREIAAEGASLAARFNQ